MFRHKFVEAYPLVLKDIIAGKYGHYELTKPTMATISGKVLPYENN
jgi:hypothetical protein